MRWSKRLVTLVSLSVFSCAPKLDTERKPVDNGSFGTTVYTIACQRVAYQRDLGDGGKVDVSGSTYRATCRQGDEPPIGAYPAIEAMHARRQALIGALDTIFPADYLSDLQDFVTSNAFLALYDDGRMEAALSKLGEFLGTMAGDPEVTASLSRLENRLGYRPLDAALGLMRAVADYDGLSDLTRDFTDAIGRSGPANEQWTKLLGALSLELQDVKLIVDPTELNAGERTLKLGLDLLLSESAYLGNGNERPLVRRDARGVAVVAKVGGVLPEPYVDSDGDGLADIDAQGNFVDASLQIIESPTPFNTPLVLEKAAARDDKGRALLSTDGPRLYEYVDLDKTVLAALSRDVPNLFDPNRGTALDMVLGASSLLGTRMPITKTYAGGAQLTYSGYDLAASPLLDIVYGVMTLLADNNMPDTLAWARALMVDHEAEAARLLEAIFEITDLADAFPDAKLEPGSPMYDDLIPVVREILATPGLAEQLVAALENPVTRNLGDRFRDHMKYTDKFTFGPAAPWPLVGKFETLVDRSKPDSAYNRSIWERLLHLIHDSSGVEMCNKQGAAIKQFGITVATYDKCKLFRIPDLAIFYVQSIAYTRSGSGFATDGGNLGTHTMPRAQLNFDFNACNVNFGNCSLVNAIANDDFIEDQATINGFRRHPTPAALNRVLLLPNPPALIADTADPVKDIDGDLFVSAHAGTLPVWEKDGFYEQIQPIVQAFADKGREDLFVDVLIVLHNHWPTPLSTDTQNQNPNGHAYANKSGAMRFEPIIVKVLEEGDFWHALTETAPEINNIQVNGKSGRTVLVNAAKFIFDEQAGLKNRVGATSTTTNDGDPVTTLSPYYVLADAYKLKAARLLEAPGEVEAWERSTGEMIDLFVRGEKVGDTWRFKNPRFRGVSIALVDFLSGRITRHKTDGDLDTWSRVELPNRTAEILTGPVFAGAADFVLSLSTVPAARIALEDFNAYLMSEAGSPDAFITALTGAADIVQLFLNDANLVPIAHLIGKALDPAFGMVDAQVEFLRGARDADSNDTLTRLLRYAFNESTTSPGKTAVGGLIDGIAEVQRSNPFVDLDKPMSSGDYATSLAAVRDFLVEEKRGFLKFVKIVQERNVR